jgi:3-methyladenine DNA glycosylase/8-oxoguanine DNA glycosylase
MITQFNLPAHQPFILRSVIYSHGWIQLAPFKEEGDRVAMTFITRLSNRHVIQIYLREAGGGVSVEIDESLGNSERDEVTRTVTWMLDLDHDFSEFYAIAQAEPCLGKAASEAKGRILRSPTLFEDVIKTILTTNTLWSATKRMNSNLVEQFGDPLPSNPSLKAFPTAEALAATTEETLRLQTRVGYRAPSILALARRVASGELDLEGLKGTELPTPELRKRLLSIHGIGPYASANLLMLLGRYNILTVDSWATKMVSQEWYGGAPVTSAQVESAFEKWGEWKGLVYWLWEFSPK